MAAALTKQIIINGDDFGMSPGINQAIKMLHRQGRLTSVSVIVNMPWSNEALAFLREAGDLSAGLHLNLTTGRPMLPAGKVPSLVETSGEFYKLHALLPRLVAGRVRQQEIQAEITAQMERCLAAGTRPQHIDSHQHLHAVPVVANEVAALMNRFRVTAVRNPDFAAFVIPPSGRDRQVKKAVRQTGKNVIRSTQERILSRSTLLNSPANRTDQLIYLRWYVRPSTDTLASMRACFSMLEGHTLEIVAHPAVADETLPTLSSYVNGREQELAFLSSDRFFELLCDFQV